MRKSTRRLLLRLLLWCAAAALTLAALFWLWVTLDWGALARWALMALAALVAGSFVFHTARNYRAIRRREALLARYGDDAIVDDLLSQTLWLGETAEQVRESLGEPVAIESIARKTKRQEVWKYAHESGNRYRLRITLDDDVVVRWDLRD